MQETTVLESLLGVKSFKFHSFLLYTLQASDFLNKPISIQSCMLYQAELQGVFKHSSCE